MPKHNNVSANDGYLLKNEILKINKSSPELLLAAGLPNISRLPLHLDFDWSSDTTPDPSSSASQSKLSSSSSLSAMIMDEPSDTSRPRLDFHATRRSPGPRGALEGEYSLHDESPFEAARRAQRNAEGTEGRPPNGTPYAPYIPGKTQFPSIKPGEIVPHYLIWTISAPPTFSPPLEAPPFPPDIGPTHYPIRAAHFPPGVHQVTAQSHNLHHGLSQTQPPFSSPPPSSSPSPIQNNPPSHVSRRSPVNGVDFRPPSQSPQQSGPQLQPPRVASPAHSSRSAPPPLQSHPPPLLVRSHTDPVREVPPSLRPSDGQYQRGTLPSLSIPRGPAPPQPMTAPPTRAASQRQFEPPPLPSSLTPVRAISQHSSPSNPLPPPRLLGHQPYVPSPLHSDFVPVSNPVRLPSENFRMAPKDQSYDALDNRRNRLTPKPVIPQPLASLTPGNYNSADKKGVPNLKRSVTDAPLKGGFLAKTKSLLRKRTSTSTIRLNTDGSIGLNTLSPLNEEGKDKRTLHKLSKRK